jgi:hypothetical protein
MPNLSHILSVMATARIADVVGVRPPVFTEVAANADVAPVTVATQPAEVVPSLESLFTARIKDVRLLRPDLADLNSKIHEPPADVPRDQITVPISLVEEVTDAVLFEAASDPGSKMYLPRYRLPVDNGRYRLSLEPSGQEWMLVIHLEKYPPPEIGPQARGAQPMDHAVTLILTHKLMMGGTSGGQKELVFQEVTAEGEGLRAVLRVGSLPERDRLYQALTDPTYGTTLNVRRALQVAIPAARVSVNWDHIGDANDVVAMAAINNKLFAATRDNRLWWRDPVGEDVNWDHIGDANDVVAMAAINNKLFAATRDNRLWWRDPVDENVNDATIPIAAASAIDDRGGFHELGPPLLGPPFGELDVSEDTEADSPALLFREVTRVMDNPLDPNPFVFPPALHGYIFVGGISSTAGQGFRLLRRQVGEHSYYQDPVRSELFYYLPDRFKVARRPQSPHLPMMQVQFTAPAADASPEAMQVSVHYAAMPWTDPERPVADAKVLRERFMPADASEALVLEPLLVDSKSLRFVLGLPRDDPTVGPYRPRDGALVDLRSGIYDMLVLTMPHFQSVFDAMFSASAALFDGWVEIDLGEGSNPRSEVIPFAARMNDLAGELFDYRQVPDEASGGVRATFRNTIESPVRINRLSAILRHNDSQVSGVLRDFSAPAQLDPGEEVTLVVAPAAPISGADPLQATFDLGDVEVLADREKIWEAILDPTTSEYRRMIQVKTPPEMFDAPADRPEEKILEIDVELKRGTERSTTVTLTAQQPETKVGLPSPISDYILRRKDIGKYRYQVTVIRRNEKVGEWKTKTADVLWILSADVN